MTKEINTNSSSQIPQELGPFYRMMISHPEQNEWANESYRTIIVPYIDNLIRTKIFNNHALTVDDFFALKSFFLNKSSSEYLKYRSKMIKLRQGLRNSERLMMQFENHFLRTVFFNSKVPLDCFLPSNYTVHLKKILKMQVLIFMRKELPAVKQTAENTKQINELKVWINREINSIGSFVRNEEQTNAQSFQPFSPSRIWHFFNGQSKLLLLVQIELVIYRDFIRQWRDTVMFLGNKGIFSGKSLNQLILSIGKFFLMMGFMSLLPYRLTRTLINETVHHASLLFFAVLSSFAHFNKHKKEWFLLDTFLQLMLYAGLIGTFGLSFIPIPEIALTSSMIFPAILLGGAYVFSMFMSVMIMSVKNHFARNDKHDLVETTFEVNKDICSKAASKSASPTLINPMYDRYRLDLQHCDFAQLKPQVDAPKRYSNSVKML